MAAVVKNARPGTVNDELGLCTSAFGHRNALSVRKLQLVEQSGLQWCEIAALQSQHIEVFDVQRVRELASALASMKLKVWSIHAPFCGLAMDDPDTRADGQRRLLQAARVGKRLGAKIIVVHPGRDVPSVNVKRELRWLAEGLARVAQQMPAGMKLGLETMGIKALAGPSADLLSVVDRVDHPAVGICFDTGHVNQGDDLFAYLRAVSGRVVTVHLHDNYGDRDAHAMPGEGNIRWPETLRALREAGYTGPWMSEAGPSGGTIAAFMKEYQRLMRGYLRQN